MARLPLGQAPLKKKKKHRGLKIFIILMVIFIVIPVASTFIFFYDGNHREIIRRDFINEPTDLFNEVIVDSFDNTNVDGETGHTFNIKITEQELNEFLSFAYDAAPSGVKQYAKNLYVDINPNEYDFVLEAQFWFFKTRGHLKCDLENDTANKQFIFHIKQIIVGRLPVELIAKGLVKYFITDEQIESMLHSAGLSMNVSIENLTMTYTYADLIHDIVTMAGSPDIAMYANFINEAFDNNLVTLYPYANHQFDAEVNLVPLHTNSTYSTPSKILDLHLNTYRTKVEAMIDDGKLGTSLTDIQTKAGKVFTYLIRGYNNVNADIQELMNNLGDLSSYGIPDVTSYVPIVDISCPTNEQIPALVSSRMQSEINAHPEYMNDPTKYYEISIDEDDLHKAFKGASTIGVTTVFVTRKETGYKSAYITFDNLYFNIVEASGSNPAKTYLNVCLSLNGYDIEFIMSVSFLQRTTWGCEFSFVGSEMYLGSTQIGDELKQSIYQILSTCLGSGAITFDMTNEKIVIDLSGSLSSSIKAAMLASGKTLKVIPSGSSISANGKYRIQIINE